MESCSVLMMILSIKTMEFPSLSALLFLITVSVVTIVEAQWEPMNSILPGVSHLRSDAGSIYAMDEQFNAVYRLHKDDMTFYPIAVSEGASFSYDVVCTDSLAWIATVSGIYRSSDNGGSWQRYGDSNTVRSRYVFPTSFAVLPPLTPGGPYEIVAGTFGIGMYASKDGGMHWDEIDSAHFHQLDILDITFGTSGAGIPILRASTFYGILSTTDRGITWEKGDSIPARPNGLLNIGKEWFSFTHEGIYRNGTAAERWERISELKTTVSDVVSVDSAILVSERGLGILRSSDHGSHWNVLPAFSGMKDDIIGMTVSHDTMYVAAGEKGFWYAPLHAVMALTVPQDQPVPESAHLEQNFPNPFNPATSITFSIPVSGHLSLTVYDILGRETMMLFDGIMSAGTHTVPFSAVSIASGTYVYRLRYGTQSFTKTMSILK